MNESNQQLLVTGSILHLARIDPATGLPLAWRDVGTINTINPAVASTSIALFDSRGGKRLKIAERVTEYAENYTDVTCSNMTLDNLAYTFGAESVGSYTQSNTALTNVPHVVSPDSILPLHDASGNYLYDIASIQSITGLTAVTHYDADPNFLKMGYVKILPTAPIAEGATINVSFTPNTITGRRTFNPHVAGVAKVELKIFWTSDDYGTLMIRDHVQATITPATPEFRDTDFSNLKFNIGILSNQRTAGRPAGRFIMPLSSGGLPARTY